MKKLRVILFSLLFAPAMVQSQELSDAELIHLFTAKDSLLRLFNDLGDFRSVTDEFDPTEATAWSNLFVAGVMVHDGIVPPRNGKGKISEKPLGVMKPPGQFTTDIKTNYPLGLEFYRVTRGKILYNKARQGIIVAILETTAEATTHDGFKISCTDTIEIEMQPALPSAQLKISSLKLLGSSIICEECPEPEPVYVEIPDTIIRQPERKDTIRKVRDPIQLPAFSWAVSGKGCYGISSIKTDDFTSAQYDTSHYSNLIVDQSETKGYRHTPKMVSSAGINLHLIIGKAEKFSINLGLLYQRGKSTLDVDTQKIAFKSYHEANSIYYKSTLTISAINEGWTIAQVSADISMALVVSLGKSLHLQPYAGVALPLQASLTYTGNALLAISNRYSGHSADGFSETDSFDDLLFSNDMAGSNSGEEETHLSTGQTVGWDATMPRNKNADEKEVTGIKANTAWFAGINLLLVPPDVSGFKIGVEMRSTTFNQEVKSFKQIDASTDTYNSYLLADDKIDWNTFTINLSYVLKF